MAKRKEIELFNIAFLDLLYGALASVIIIFIIIPKEKKEHRLAAEALSKFHLSIEQLDSIIKNSVNQEVYDDVAVQFLAIRGKIGTLANDIDALEGDKEKCEDAFTMLREQHEELLKQIQDCMAELENCQSDKGALNNQLADYKVYYTWMMKCGFNLEQKCPPPPTASPVSSSPKDLDVGFKFRGKNIVLVLDVSGSMLPNINEYGENRLADVLGGLKMLIATFDPSYKFDIVNFPDYNLKKGTCKDFAWNWGEFREATDSNKTQAVKYLIKVEPGGSNPTRSTLKYVLQTYHDATDIILFSDGQPMTLCDSRSNLNKVEIINSVVSEITTINAGRVKISCIGVGHDFYDNPTSDFVMFLKDLSAQNGGFFVGF